MNDQIRVSRIVSMLGAGVLAASIAGCNSPGDSQNGSVPAGGAASTPANVLANAAMAKASIEGRSGSKLTGEAVFTEVNGKVQVVVMVAGAPPGLHAVHIHEKGDCSSADATSAGGHFNPGQKKHGDPKADEHHAGDFGNMEVGANGSGRLELHTSAITVAAGPSSVVGKAIIVHEKADDFTTQPTGNAGARLGCGEIR